MSMNQHPHPDDERLSALAAADDDARTDAALRAHVETCDRCRSLMGELTSLRTHLAALPDIVPPRPIRIVLPPREVAPSGLGQVVRRLFAPALAAGATLALVGAVGLGTSSLGLGGGASTSISTEAGDGAAMFDTLASSAAEESAAAASGAEDGAGVVAAASDDAQGREGVTEAPFQTPAAQSLEASGEPEAASAAPTDQAGGTGGAPWLPLFIGGVTLSGLALFLRYAVVPRAG